MPLPKSYTQKPDGDFQLWNHGNVEPAVLSRWNPDQDHTYIRGVLVYGLYFEDDAGAGKHWNCQFGWIEKGML